MFSLEKFKEGAAWTNWSQRFVSYPTYYAPQSVDELVQIVKDHSQSSRTIRVTGAAHSFSPVALPESSALTLHHLRGLISVDKEKMEATFYAGTYLYEIGPLLEQHGLAVLNMGDINVQTLAGVISTGTHGTGVTLGSFSSMVTKWTFVNGLGEVMTHERGEDDLSHALHVSLGLLGILVAVTIRVIPLYSLHYRSSRENLHTSLQTFQQDIRQHRHVEWYYFPCSETIQVKKMDLIPPKYATARERTMENLKLEMIENRLFEVASKVCKLKPQFSTMVSQLSSKLITEGEKVDICYMVYPTPRRVKFNEAEFAIPLQQFEACMEEIHATMKAEKFNVHFPIECRTTAGEAGFLSPTQGEESAFLAFHMYQGMDESRYFQWVFSMMEKYGARAHWGKMNRYTKENIDLYYPHAQKINKIRQKLDPADIFVTHYFNKIFC
ncbi:D-arabinono-1,4-lactone oxidase [Lysinibacillus sp. LZ02]|uniref:D-arabinono-1,4-lactone oxidase n=1 Tax=Lysinibacillus sp. LZ02 TaxID=3420668 RepID=UPI003D36CC6A